MSVDFDLAEIAFLPQNGQLRSHAVFFLLGRAAAGGVAHMDGGITGNMPALGGHPSGSVGPGFVGKECQGAGLDISAGAGVAVHKRPVLPRVDDPEHGAVRNSVHHQGGAAFLGAQTGGRFGGDHGQHLARRGFRFPGQAIGVHHHFRIVQPDAGAGEPHVNHADGGLISLLIRVYGRGERAVGGSGLSKTSGPGGVVCAASVRCGAFVSDLADIAVFIRVCAG